jgi:hypothetical protein
VKDPEMQAKIQEFRKQVVEAAKGRRAALERSALDRK